MKKKTINKILIIIAILTLSFSLMSSSDCSEVNSNRREKVFEVETLGYDDGNKLLKVSYKGRNYIVMQNQTKRTMVLLTVE